MRNSRKNIFVCDAGKILLKLILKVIKQKKAGQSYRWIKMTLARLFLEVVLKDDSHVTRGKLPKFVQRGTDDY